MPIPMLADFAVRLACGLAILLLIAPWRVVPPGYFRTNGQVILGLLVLAALDLSHAGVGGPLLASVVAGSVLAFVASVVWGLGLPRLAVPITCLLVLACGGVLVVASRADGWEPWALNAAGRFASAFLMGATLSAMLLGHHYLTAPTMSIKPLERFVGCMAWGLGARVIVAALGWWLWHEGLDGSHGPGQVSSFFLAIRWGMGAGDLLDMEDRRDPIDAVGYRHPLHRDDVRPVRRTDRPDPGARHGDRPLIRKPGEPAFRC
jgi:hypothetical protein